MRQCQLPQVCNFIGRPCPPRRRINRFLRHEIGLLHTVEAGTQRPSPDDAARPADALADELPVDHDVAHIIFLEHLIAEVVVRLSVGRGNPQNRGDLLTLGLESYSS